MTYHFSYLSVGTHFLNKICRIPEQYLALAHMLPEVVSVMTLQVPRGGYVAGTLPQTHTLPVTPNTTHSSEQNGHMFLQYDLQVQLIKYDFFKNCENVLLHSLKTVCVVGGTT